MAVCAFCGAYSPEAAAFCDECGRPIQDLGSGSAGTAGRVEPVAEGMPIARLHPEAPPLVTSTVCPACGMQAGPMDSFCGNCGVSLKARGAAPSLSSRPSVHRASPEKHCTHCGAELTQESVFCDRCGAAVEGGPEPDAAGLVSKSVPLSGPVTTSDQARQKLEAAAWQIERPSGQPVKMSSGGELPHSIDDVRVPSSVSPAVRSLPASDVLARIVHPASGLGLALPVGRAEATLGRDDPVRGIYPDLDLTDYGGPIGGVSRLHARITIVPTESTNGFMFYIEDLESVNGTFVNDVALAPGVRCQLHDGDALRLGRVKVVFQIASPKADF